MTKELLIQEFKFEDERCKYYFSLMYKVIQFTFVAIVALIVCALENNINDTTKNLILSLVLPICIYVFGTMYLYNVYALSVCGKRAELIHKQIFNNRELKEIESDELRELLAKYVIGDRKLSMLYNGVCLGFYITIPIGSYILSMEFPKFGGAFFQIAPIVCMILFYGLILFIMPTLIKEFRATNKIQKNDK